MKKFLLTLICVLMATVTALAQGNRVQGTVVDENGEPVIGASVTLKGSSKGVITDVDGNFALDNALGKTLVISYIGYDKQEVKATRNMRIMLQSDATSLDEVVVTGMQKMDKRLFTGATSKVDAEKAKLNGVADISCARCYIYLWFF